MRKVLKRLKEVTKDCEFDMHEPSDQGVSAVVSGWYLGNAIFDIHEPNDLGIGVVVSGWHLDNAMGDDPSHNCGELTVGIKRELSPGDTHIEWFNLATLIAIARATEEKDVPNY